jgi:hypothetical protein
MPQLVADSGHAVPLPCAFTVIGTDPSCELPLRPGMGIGARSLELRMEADHCHFEVLEPGQLFTVNGCAVTEGELYDGDTFTLGSLRVTYCSPEHQRPAIPHGAEPSRLIAPAPGFDDTHASQLMPQHRPAYQPMSHAPMTDPVSGATFTPNQLIGVAAALLVLCLAYVGMQFASPQRDLKQAELRRIEAHVLGSRTVGVSRSTREQVLDTDHGSYILPKDMRFHPAWAQAPSGVVIEVQSGATPSNEGHNLVTLSINDQQVRSLTQHNTFEKQQAQGLLWAAGVLGALALGLMWYGFASKTPARIV